MKESSKPLLKVENLEAFYGSLQAVKEISFSLFPATTLTLVGESGSGKSTIALSIVNALEGAIKGKIEKRGKIAMIFQDPSSALNPVYTIGWQLMEAIQLKLELDEEAGYRRAIESLKEVQLQQPEAIFEKYPHELSGGQRQRAMIAMALVGNPDLLIADEPTTALDVTVQIEILKLIKRLQNERHMALLLITHDMAVVEKMADEVIVLYAGEKVEQGKVKDILYRPKHPYTEALIEASFLEVDQEGRLSPIKGNVPSLGQEPTGCRFHPRCPHVFETCKQEKVPLYSIDKGSVRCFLFEGGIKRIDQPGIFKRETNFFQPQSEIDPLLTVDRLTKKFPLYHGAFRRVENYLEAVSEVSFQVNKNEVLGIVGESGSGKTTLGKMIAGLIEPTSGSFTLKKPAQMIFQDPGAAMNPRHTVGQALVEPLIYHKLAKNLDEAVEKALSLAKKMGFDSQFYNRYPHEFSLGQKQRLAICRSLLLNPELIICDEPVSALDVSVQAQILNLFLELKSMFSTSLLFISHDLSVVKYLCSRVLVMKSGKIVEAGTVQEIFENPQDEYTKHLIAGARYHGL
ncbi:MAG: ABC transporter ATP-binding protein [Chlamydiia bacterium]|nr:ABC transporter ATP-binding protein [Chlamydiia bacterium]